jgi:hypothetical protein
MYESPNEHRHWCVSLIFIKILGGLQTYSPYGQATDPSTYSHLYHTKASLNLGLNSECDLYISSVFRSADKLHVTLRYRSFSWFADNIVN